MTSTPNTAAVRNFAAAEHSRRLEALIREEAAIRGGLLPFDRFMELALYAPELGYYVAGARKLGPAGDFVTAPEISPLFGRCLAAQSREVLEGLDGGDVLELGAGSGALAVGVLSALEEAGALPGRYLILEVSPDLKERQRSLLAERLPRLVARIQWLERLPERFRGVVLANEVLDAMPVHRFRVGADGAPLEVFVRPVAQVRRQGLAEDIQNPALPAEEDRGEEDSHDARDQYCRRGYVHPSGWGELAGAPVSPELAVAVRALQAEGLALEPGFGSEINLRLAPWLAALSAAVESALVLLIDYGYTCREYYRAERRDGTLMCHYLHRAHADPYRNLGLQDITAHVDFSAVADSGRAAGFGLAGYATQAHFLLGCGLDGLLAEAAAGEDAMQVLSGARQLVLPQAMGERFRVMGLTKGISGPWRGFSVRDLSDRL